MHPCELSVHQEKVQLYICGNTPQVRQQVYCHILTGENIGEELLVRLPQLFQQVQLLQLGTEKARNAEGYRAFSARSYSDATHITTLCLYVDHCFMSCKHTAVKSVAPKRHHCASASKTKADSEGKWLRETTIRVTLQLPKILRGYGLRWPQKHFHMA